MNETQQADAAKNFSNYWHGRGNESSNYQDFWRDLLHDVFGVERTTGFIKFIEPVDDTLFRMDAYIPRTKVLIEHKSFDKDLTKKFLQSDGEFLTPFEQAKRYADDLPDDKKPRYIVTCNFAEFHIYDLQQMDSPEFILQAETYKPTVIKLENFRSDFKQLKFIVDPNAKIQTEIKISTDAAQIVRKICRAIDKNYTDKDDAYIDNLSKLCARLVFCFYADDSQLFTHSKFADYLKNFSPNQLKDALQNFFDALNTPEDKRNDLKDFPYVNGGLFEEKLPIPTLNKDFHLAVMRAHILEMRFDAFIKFSWREINPTIFGAMFESVFNDDTRREDGIHYTSIENIHKVIDPLFLDDLNAEFELARRKHIKNRPKALRDLQNKIASLNFLDPACGSGNFLTETYLSLRGLENKILAELRNIYADTPADSVKVSPRQFYGIEINAFAVAIAKVALSIAENQMRRKSDWILGRVAPELPLTKYISIRKANANQIDWSSVVAPANIDYIIGNPPFVGYSNQNKAQKDDMRRVFADNPKAGKLDYVAAWYRKAAEFIQGTTIRCAFVSTNSICQGEQCADVWKILYEKFNIHVDFAHRTFKWLSDSDNMAHVHCVVVGFSSAPNDKLKKIFDGDKVYIVDNINFYLTDGDIVFVEARANPLQDDVPKMYEGSKPADGGALIIEADDYEPFIKLEPAAQKFILPLLGAEEFIKGKRRYCLWLEGVPLAEIKAMPLIAERVEACRQFRLQSKKAVTRDSSETPQLFQEIRQPRTNYILIPVTSSERRRYVPMGFVNANVIATNSVHIIPSAQIYHFGVLTSSISMAWMRAVGSRMEMRYRYSANTVYNNFPWCEPTPEQKQLIEESAQKILDVRAKYPDWTLAKLYNEETMPAALRSAHKWNDYNVALAYGMEKFLEDEARIVAELMRRYEALTKD